MTHRSPSIRHGVAFASWPEGIPADPAFFRNLGRRVEEIGFDMVLCGDHIYHNAPLPECLISLMDLGAVTSRITLGSCVLQLPMRDPSLTAKQIATIDHLTGGRFLFGAGIGGEYDREWEAVDVERDTRGKRMDEYLDIMRELWRGERTSYEGQFRRMHDVTLSPRPAQAGGPPIFIGGRSDAALRRATRFDGWIGYASSVRRAQESAQKIQEFGDGKLSPDFRVGMSIFFLVAKSKEEAVARVAERLNHYYDQDFSSIVDSIAVVGTSDQVRQRFEQYREAGVRDFIWSRAVPSSHYLEQFEIIADLVGVSGMSTGGVTGMRPRR